MTFVIQEHADTSLRRTEGGEVCMSQRHLLLSTQLMMLEGKSSIEVGISTVKVRPDGRVAKTEVRGIVQNF